MQNFEVGDFVIFMSNNQQRIVLSQKGHGPVTVLKIDNELNGKIECFVRDPHFYFKIALDLS